LQCIAVCCSVLQCIAVYCSVLQCVAVCCSVLQCVAEDICCFPYTYNIHAQSHTLATALTHMNKSCRTNMNVSCSTFCSVFRCAALCWSALQCVTACCSVLQCVNVSYSTYEWGMPYIKHSHSAVSTLFSIHLVATGIKYGNNEIRIRPRIFFRENNICNNMEIWQYNTSLPRVVTW